MFKPTYNTTISCLVRWPVSCCVPMLVQQHRSSPLWLHSWPLSSGLDAQVTTQPSLTRRWEKLVGVEGQVELLMCHTYYRHPLCIGNSRQEKVSGFSWPVLDRQQGIDWHTREFEDGSLSPTSLLDWCSSDAEYLEQFSRNSGRASPAIDMGGGGWAAHWFDIVCDYTTHSINKSNRANLVH